MHEQIRHTDYFLTRKVAIVSCSLLTPPFVAHPQWLRANRRLDYPSRFVLLHITYGRCFKFGRTIAINLDLFIRRLVLQTDFNM